MIRFSILLLLLIPILVSAQTNPLTISGIVRDRKTATPLAFANIVLKKAADSGFVVGTITNEVGRFELAGVSPDDYLLEISLTGFKTEKRPFLAGKMSLFLNLGAFELVPDARLLNEVTVTANRADGIDNKLDKKTFTIENNITQGGSSLLQALRNLPGITTDGDGKVQLRGSDKVTVLVDGKQTALTGFGNAGALDNIPASAIEKIEIINNPSARYDANGAAGIINIVYKKKAQEGFNGKVGLVVGAGALWQKKESLPTIRPQYQGTPKINPSLTLNYRKKQYNLFFQGDYLYNKTLNKNDFTDRYFSNGDTIRNQVKRNRITTVGTVKSGLDFQFNTNNSITVYGLFSSEYVRDWGDIPYFNSKLSQRSRLWQFYEDEVNTAATGAASFQHKFREPGHLLQVALNYTFHREDEKYFLTEIRPTYIGQDTFMLLADEHVTDLRVDYTKPLKSGRLEAGAKFRRRTIPTNMQFFPGINSPLDTNAGGRADYLETIPALYGNYVFESKQFEVEAGMRVEYVRLDYKVNSSHNTYKSEGYSYTQPFPSIRLGYQLTSRSKLSAFFNRRVDRPDEVDIRIFPKYDDPEILKVGNPGLRPQFTNSVEAGYKKLITAGSLYAALYFRTTKGTITRIGTIRPNSTIIYSVFQNAGRSSNAGLEAVYQQNWSKGVSFNVNTNIYKNTINSFTVENKYPVPTTFSAGKESALSGNVKVNAFVDLQRNMNMQLTAIYLAPDIIPQGKIKARYSIDGGLKKTIQGGKGAFLLNATDIFNTLRTVREIRGTGFQFSSSDYYETQVFRLGYSYKF